MNSVATISDKVAQDLMMTIGATTPDKLARDLMMSTGATASETRNRDPRMNTGAIASDKRTQDTREGSPKPEESLTASTEYKDSGAEEAEQLTCDEKQIFLLKVSTRIRTAHWSSQQYQ
jgi:hypothetical protein